jgi:hypothetical protein
LREQEEFLTVPAPDALDKLVDDLLSRPAYGERWARHWLDLVRYAETNGYERDAKKPWVWRYRDWVIRSLNQDKPFDRFVTEQLAGDELDERNAGTLVATGYYRLGPWDDEPADRLQARFDQLDDIISTTSQAFLGITLGCARCHDHKFDPLTARDYYRMAAIFNGLERPVRGRKELDLPIGTPEQLKTEAARDSRIAPLEKEIEAIKAPFRIEFLKSGKSKLPGEVVEASLVEPAKRTEVQMAYADPFAEALDGEVMAALPQDLRARIEPLQNRIERIRSEKPDLPRGYFFAEPDSQPPVTHVLKRGQASQPGDEVSAGVPEILGGELPLLAGAPKTDRRRLAFAQWLTRPENPLTARVIVNRIWQFHFGEGIVRTPSDFGRIGERPTHPELLDWLAGWFVEQGWSLKKLHRLIMTSNTYRMSRQWNVEYGAKDPENRLLWRVSPKRLEVEAIRDSMLAVSGRLNRKMYGPSMYPPVQKAVLEASGKPEGAWTASDADEASRRSIYAHIKRSMLIPMFEMLDFCDTARSADKRLVTSVAPQALTLFNGEFVNRQAGYFAQRVLNEAGRDPAKQVEYAYLLALARPPSDVEAGDMIGFLKSEVEALARESLDKDNAALLALEQLCRVILNLNEFVYTD